jgi:hypothetical protein
MEEPVTEKVRKHAEKERERIEKEEDEVVVNSDESFPASDPPSFNPGITGPTDIEPLEKEAEKKK